MTDIFYCHLLLLGAFFKLKISLFFFNFHMQIAVFSALSPSRLAVDNARKRCAALVVYHYNPDFDNHASLF